MNVSFAKHRPSYKKKHIQINYHGISYTMMKKGNGTEISSTVGDLI